MIRNFWTGIATRVRALFPVSSGFKRRTKRSLRIEHLEHRLCLAAAPLSVVDPWADMDRGTVYEYPAYVAHSTAGKQDVPIVDLYVESNVGGDRLQTLTLRGTGIDRSSLASVVSAFELLGDLDQDGSFETRMASVRPTNTGVTFDRLSTDIGSQGLSLRVVADTKPTLAQQAVFGLDVSSVKFVDGRNKAVPGSQISIMDRNGGTLVVDAQECVLYGGLYSPPDVRYNPGTRDAVLARFDSFATEGDVRVNQLAFVIEGRDSLHNPIATSVIAKALSYVELRNVVSGQVVPAERIMKADGYLVFKVSNFVLKNGESWEIRADIADSSVVRQGDRFRVGINMEENPQSLTSFNGLLPRRVANMSFLATDLDSKKKVEVQPGGVLFGNYVQVARTEFSVASPIHVVTMSKVAAIANANPDPDNSPVPIGVSSVGQFRFLAASNSNVLNGLNRVQIGGLVVTIDASNVEVDASSFYLSNKADGTTRVQGILRDASGARLLGNQMLNGTYYVEFNNLHQSIVSTMIDPGQSATFVVSAEIRSSGAAAGLQMSLDHFNDPLSSSFAWNASHVQWNDVDVFSTPFYGFEYPDTVVRSTRYRN